MLIYFAFVHGLNHEEDGKDECSDDQESDDEIPPLQAKRRDNVCCHNKQDGGTDSLDANEPRQLATPLMEKMNFFDDKRRKSFTLACRHAEEVPASNVTGEAGGISAPKASDDKKEQGKQEDRPATNCQR